MGKQAWGQGTTTRWPELHCAYAPLGAGVAGFAREGEGCFKENLAGGLLGSPRSQDRSPEARFKTPGYLGQSPLD